MSPWTIIELGKLTKNAQFEICSDIQKYVPTYGLLLDNIDYSTCSFLSHEQVVETDSDKTHGSKDFVKPLNEDSKYNFLGIHFGSEECLNFDIFPLGGDAVCNSLKHTESSSKKGVEYDVSYLCSQSHGGMLTHFLHPSTFFAYE